ncbi:MAG: ABC transporter ATP-binding protein [SAR202 cluster bacterium]|nr:ABC transporter ATP-binding protein [SAR202 cluster bacterium]MDP6512164.1 ABC transporter ATP-binding protein [SAR202 cluster bacterium]MDP6713496.1 ABC transporter ATP-binding protein [SAR202 cluster bacterium]
MAERNGKTPVIELHNVTKRYDIGTSTVIALLDVDLTVAPGEFVVVLGPSGCGKTTLLNTIGALDTPTEGSVMVAGQDITTASRSELFAFRRNSVSFVFQSFNIFPGLTALENVQFGADVSGKKNGVTAQQVLEQVGLGERAQHFPHELSGGEQQRVAIARALATDNPILLADEPTGELDFATGSRILELLISQAEQGKAVLVVTHNREISRIADRVIELSGGRIISDGPPPDGKADIAELSW